MRTMIGIAVCAVAVATVVAQEHASKENQVHDRGQTPVQQESQSLDRGRLGTQASVPPEDITISGILVDAGCRNRTPQNFALSPLPRANELPAEPAQEKATQEGNRGKLGYATGAGEPQSPSMTAFGISVDGKTLQGERGEVLAHQVPDLFSRELDPSCAITGGTRAFAILLQNGRLLNLDEGGNTWAMQSVQSSTQGHDMLNGKARGLKPKVNVLGHVRNDQLVVDALKLS